MDIKSLIPEKYLFYLEQFSRTGYRGAFEKYCAETEGVFAALESMPQNIAAAANALIEYVDMLIPKWFRRKLVFFDIKRFLFLYTVPAALKYGGEAAVCFVNTLRELWQKKYPNDPLNIANFEEINGSFRTTIMGFEFGGKD